MYYRKKKKREGNLAIKETIFKEILIIAQHAKRDKPEDIEDYNVNNFNAKRYRELLSLWWSLPCGIDFVPYNINKGKTFGVLNKYIV